MLRILAFLLGILAVVASYKLSGWMLALSTAVCFLIGFLWGRRDSKRREALRRPISGSGYVSDEGAKNRYDC